MHDPTATITSGPRRCDGNVALTAPVERARRRSRAPRFSHEPGDRPLAGFIIERGVGKGGFGEVYRATTDAGQPVALKLLTQDGDVELRGVGECLELRHTNLLALFAVRHDEAGFPWVVMEYIAGPNLKQLLERHPRGLPREHVARIFAGLVAGVGCLHAAGIVHRDLKPANIFFDGDLVKIGDYGLAKAMAHSRRSGHTESVGTCLYMAPEIGHGRYGREVDTYALGALLHEMLTGRVPFDGESSQEVLMKHLTCEPDLSGFGPALRNIFRRSLAKRPEERYATVAEMGEAVAAALALDEDIDQSDDDAAGTPRSAARTHLGSTHRVGPVIVTAPSSVSNAHPRPAPTVATEHGSLRMEADATPPTDWFLLLRTIVVLGVLLGWCIWQGWFWMLVLAGVSLYAVGLAVRGLAMVLFPEAMPLEPEPRAEEQGEWVGYDLPVQ